MGVDKDHQIVGKPRVLDVVILPRVRVFSFARSSIRSTSLR